MSASVHGPVEVPHGYCHCGCGQRTSICLVNNAPRGLVKGEPRRFIVGHSRSSSGVDYLEEDRGHSTPCWIWQRFLTNGYGRIYKDGRKVLAHRWYYEQAKGPIGDLHLDHLCRVPACVNPDHLEPVTMTENARRGANSKLTPDAVVEILSSDEPHTVLARRFGVSPPAIASVRKRRSWREEVALPRLRSFAEDLVAARRMRVPPGRERFLPLVLAAPAGEAA